MKVLFVCSGNAYRSPVAEALLKRLRPDIEVDSAGIRVAVPISEDARAYLVKENAEQYLKKVPRSLEGKQLDEYDLIVAMEHRHKEVIISKCPECEGKTIVWNIKDPYFSLNGNTEKIYKQIKEKVTDLANSL